MRKGECEDEIGVLKVEVGRLEEEKAELSRRAGNSQNWQREFIEKNKYVFNSCKQYLQEKEA